MNWPWVSRVRLEEMTARFLQADEERLLLLRRLMGMAADSRDDESDAPNPHAQRPGRGDLTESFTTPFDRAEKRFEQQFRGKPIPAQYKARVR